MHRRLTFGQIDRSTRFAAPRLKYFTPCVEPLEERRLLTASGILVSTYDDSAGHSVLAYQTVPDLQSGSVATGTHGLAAVEGIAVASDGSYYVSNDASYPAGNVLHFSASGAYMDTLGANDQPGHQVAMVAPGHLEFGPNGHLYVADVGTGQIYQFDTTSNSQQYLDSDTLQLAYAPGGFTFDQDGTNDLIVGDLEGHGVFRYHNGVQSTLIAGSADPEGMTPAAILALPNGDFLIGDIAFFGQSASLHNHVLKYDHTNPGVTSTFITLTRPVGTLESAGFPPQAESLAFDRDGNLLVGTSSDHNGTGAIEKFNLDTGAWMSTLVTGIGTPTGVALAGTGKILVSTYDDSSGYSVLAYQTVPDLQSGSVATGTHGLAAVEGIAVASDGSYYVSNDASYPAGNVLHFSASGAYMDTLGANDQPGHQVAMVAPGHLEFGPNGHLYVADVGTGQIYQFDTTSNSQQYLDSDTLQLAYAPGGFTFDQDGTNDLIVGDLEGHGVFRYHNGVQSTLIAGSADPEGMTPAAILALPNGDFLIGDIAFFGQSASLHNHVLKYDHTNPGVTSTFITLTRPVGTLESAGFPPQAESLAFDRDGNLLVGTSSDHNGTGAIEKFNLDTGAWMSTLVTGIGTPTGVALAGTGKILVSTYDDSSGYSVLAYQTVPDLQSGSVATGTHGLAAVEGIAVASDGSYYVSNDASYPAGNVLHFSASGAYMDTLGANDQPGHQVAMVAPGHLEFGPNGHLYVADVGTGQIYQFDTTSNSQQYLDSDTLQLAYAPGGFTFDQDGTNDLIVGDLEGHGVFRYHNGVQSTLIAGSADPEGMTPAAILALPNGDFLIGDIAFFGQSASLHNHVLKYDHTNPGVTSTFITLTRPVGTLESAGFPPQAESLAFDRDGNLLVGTSSDHNGTGAIEKFNLDTGAWMSTLVTGIGTPTGIALFTIPSAPTDEPPAVDLDSVAGGTGYTQTYSGAAVMITNANATLSDADSTNLSSLTAAIVGTHAGDTLTANTAGTSIMASYAGGTLSLTGSDSVANYQAVLRTIRYQNTSGGPGTSIVTINVTANDGSLNSNTAASTIDIPPSLDLDSVASGTGFTTGWYNSGTNAGGAVPITNMTNATVRAPSGVANLTDMTITLTSFHTGDVLAIPSLPIPGLNITPSYSSGTLSLIGSDTVAHYQEVLRFISYNNTTGVGPGVSTVTAQIVATDGTFSSNAVTATINITNGQSGGGQVLGNRLFYNNSKYDNNNTAINGASDDAAIATDKIGYISGTGTAASYANVSNFFRGITGVMVDLSHAIGTHSNITLSSNDITFKFIAASANATLTNNVGGWGAAPAPVAISTRISAGTGGSDRIEITWNNSSIKQGWLEVMVKANANTGLTNPDIFYFGSAIGDSGVGDSATLAVTNASDVTPPRNNNIGLTTPVWNVMDYTRDGAVNGSDPTQAQNNGVNLKLLANSLTGPFAPDAGGGVSSGLAAGSASSSTSSSSAPAWLVSRLQSAGDLNTGDIASYFRQLAGENTDEDREILLEADQAASDLGLNDDLVDSLLADLGLA